MWGASVSFSQVFIRSLLFSTFVLGGGGKCSDRMNWGIYFGYCYWDGDYILHTKQVTDSGAGSPSNSMLSS